MVEEAESLLLGPWHTLGFRLQLFPDSRPAWLGTLSSGALSGCLRSSSAVPTFPTLPDVGSLTHLNKPLRFYYNQDYCFYCYCSCILPSYQHACHLPPERLGDLPRLGTLETWNRILSPEVQSSDTAFFLDGSVPVCLLRRA